MRLEDGELEFKGFFPPRHNMTNLLSSVDRNQNAFNAYLFFIIKNKNYLS